MERGPRERPRQTPPEFIQDAGDGMLCALSQSVNIAPRPPPGRHMSKHRADVGWDCFRVGGTWATHTHTHLQCAGAACAAMPVVRRSCAPRPRPLFRVRRPFRVVAALLPVRRMACRPSGTLARLLWVRAIDSALHLCRILAAEGRQNEHDFPRVLDHHCISC